MIDKEIVLELHKAGINEKELNNAELEMIITSHDAVLKMAEEYAKINAELSKYEPNIKNIMAFMKVTRTKIYDPSFLHVKNYLDYMLNKYSVAEGVSIRERILAKEKKEQFKITASKDIEIRNLLSENDQLRIENANLRREMRP